MVSRITKGILSGLAALLPVLASTQAWAADTPPWPKPPATFVFIIIAVVLGGAILAMLIIRSALTTSTWSLTDALSEATEVTATVINAAGQAEPRLDPSGKPVLVTEMRASTSRLIALMGMMAIMLMFLGFGAFTLYAFAFSGTVSPSMEDVIKFLVAGLTLFAPYVVNKFSSIFESLSPRK